jgi:hypothetical protein
VPKFKIARPTDAFLEVQEPGHAGVKAGDQKGSRPSSSIRFSLPAKAVRSGNVPMTIVPRLVEVLTILLHSIDTRGVPPG